MEKRGLGLVGQAPGFQQGAPVGRVGVEGSEQVEGFPDADVVGQGGLLELHADPAAQFALLGARVEAQHVDLAAVGAAHACQALHRGGLAGAVRADHAEDFAALHAKGNIFHGGNLTVVFGQILDRDDI